VVVTKIDGTPGVGKTALAVHAAHLLLAEFPDGHLYADLHGYTEGQRPAEPSEVLDLFLRSLGIPAEKMPVGLEERSGLLRQLLAPLRVLMVLDNVADEAQVRPLLPGAGASLVLITSRGVLAGLEVHQRIDLDVLPPEEATALLDRLIGLERAAAEPHAAAQVRDQCGRLPLALRIAGQILASHQAWAVAKLVGMLEEEQHRLDRLEAGDLQVRAAFMVSYQLLADADKRMFRLLGLHPGPYFDVPAAAELAGIETKEAEQVLNRLALAHLITEDASGQFGMHDLLRLFSRQTCQDTDEQTTRDAAEARLVSHYADLAEFLNDCLDPQGRSAMSDAFAQAGGRMPTPREVLAVFETQRPSMLAALRLAVERELHEKVWKLSECMRDALVRLRHLDDMLAVTEAGLASASEAGNRAAETTALQNLGTAYSELRRFEDAITCYKQGLVICRETGDRRSEGLALGNLGMAYQELQRFEDAVSCSRDALVICRETGERRGEALALGNLGYAYRELQRSEDAVSYSQDALVICRETGDRLYEGQILGNLGTVYAMLQQFEDAVTYLRDALVICRETGDRHGEGLALYSLGRAHEELRQFEDAVSSLRDALAIFRETDDRRNEGLTLAVLYFTYQGLHQPDQAASCLRDALEAIREAGDHELAAHLEQAASIQP
jgi:tetratricopeptide (TPR) repeat protein